MLQVECHLTSVASEHPPLSWKKTARQSMSVVVFYGICFVCSYLDWKIIVTKRVRCLKIKNNKKGKKRKEQFDTFPMKLIMWTRLSAFFFCLFCFIFSLLSFNTLSSPLPLAEGVYIFLLVGRLGLKYFKFCGETWLQLHSLATAFSYYHWSFSFSDFAGVFFNYSYFQICSSLW